MPTLLFGIIYLFYPAMLTPYNHKLFLLLIFFYTCVIPLGSIYIMYKLGTLKSVRFDDKSSLLMPYVFISFFYLTITYLLKEQFKVNSSVLTIMAGFSLIFVLVTVINYFWKISGHSAAIMSVIGCLTALNIKLHLDTLLFPLIFLILSAGLLMSARLYLNIHNPRQILAGSVTGFLIGFTSVLFFV